MRTAFAKQVRLNILLISHYNERRFDMQNFFADMFKKHASARVGCGDIAITDCIVCDGDCNATCFEECSENCSENNGTNVCSGCNGGCHSTCVGYCKTFCASVAFFK